MAWSSRLGMRWSSQLFSINAQENVVPATYAESGKDSQQSMNDVDPALHLVIYSMFFNIFK